MRKLASIRKIADIQPIPDADAIEVAVVDGWKAVVKKGEFKVGELVVYLEVDSWVPTELAPFLSKGKEPREFNGVKGERLRTIKLRGQLSQGLILPLVIAIEKFVDSKFDEGQELCEFFFPGQDVTDMLGIQKWEKPVPAQLAGQVRGNFPGEVPKTDQERAQNLVEEIAAAQRAGLLFEVTEKLEGSSCTFYLDIEGEFHVCSRNLDLKRDENNSFWRAAIMFRAEEVMRVSGLTGVAIQGELIGPGIQGNIYGLADIEFRMFDVYDVRQGRYLTPVERMRLVSATGLKHVPIAAWDKDLSTGIVDDLLAMADGESYLKVGVAREGLVWKEMNGGLTFKTISNAYLMNE
jgi:RNA ligase (TIGR02306 family)